MANVLVPLAQGCEELEAVTLIDLLRRAQITVITAGLSKEVITASRGTRLLADMTLDEAIKQDYDLIALPGGQPGANNLNADSRIRELLQRTARNGGYVAAICAAPKVLANADLLVGKRATCYPGSMSPQELRGVVQSNDPVVHDGNVITSKGPGTAMDFTLYLIELLTDRATRDKVEAGLQRTSL